MKILQRIAISLIALFLLGKTLFALTYVEPLTFALLGEILAHGMRHDAGLLGYALVLPTLLLWLREAAGRLPVERLLRGYLCLLLPLLLVIFATDYFLYDFWHLKLDATIFLYLDSPVEAMASVSGWFVAWRVGVVIGLIFAMEWAVLRLPLPLPRPKLWHHALYPLLLGVYFLCIRGGVSESTLNVGSVYFSERTEANHAAVNPIFSLMYSSLKSERYDEQYRFMPGQEAELMVGPMLPIAEHSEADTTLLNTRRPNVLLIVWEGAGSVFFPQLGGVDARVTPCMQREMQRGINFTGLYATAMRTDRGLLSLLSGEVAYPSVSLMRINRIGDRLPNVAHAFAEEGYRTTFVYGGDINFTNMHGYLLAGGFQSLISNQDFTSQERATGEWGVTDSIVVERLYNKVVADSRGGGKWFTTCLTLSSHEPWEVPYTRLADVNPIVNAFAYTDQQLGRLLERLRTEQPDVWQNMLVIVTPDHSCRYGVETMEERFFHIPMLWTGGVVRKAKEVPTLMSQSDIAATLLAVLGMDHSAFHYSRNVLSPTYTYPSAYASTPEGIALRDTTGYTFYDLNAGRTIVDEGEGSDLREMRAKAMLQMSYDLLEERKTPL